MNAQKIDVLEWMRQCASDEVLEAVAELIEALRTLELEVRDIRGVDVEEYKPEAFARARAALARIGGDA